MTKPLWQPSASIDILKKRSLLNQEVRDFFVKRGYFEVETPAMAHHGVSDVYLKNIEATFRENNYFLQTSPEYHMKRLLAAGSGAIFQIAKVFRDDELGRHHNPEFSLLEWYRPGFDHHQLMDEVADLLQCIIPNCPALKKMTYDEVFFLACGIELHACSIDTLKQALTEYQLADVLDEDDQDVDQYLFLLMAMVVEPWMAKFNQPIAVYDFPKTQAALARIENGVARRFEIYYKGIELANGFYELCDAKQQLLRFNDDNQKRKLAGLPKRKEDKWLLAALSHGIPDCSGVALGLDRLYMIALNKPHIEDVLAFAFDRS